MYSIIQKIYEKNNKILKEGVKKVLKKILDCKILIKRLYINDL